MKTWHFVAAISVLLLAAVLIQVRRDNGWQPYEPATPVMWLKAGPAMERATLGYDAILSDLYWIRTVVYFGRQRLSKDASKNYDLLYPLLEVVTTLDPQFAVAYRFGSFFLSERDPNGPFRPDQAIALLQRGAERNPVRWEYPHDIAFVYYFSYRDYPTASQWFARASEIPGAPIWLKSMAAVTLTRGGDRDASRFLWRELYEGTEAEPIRESVLIRLAQLDAFDQIDQLNQIVSRYQASAGRFPESWNALISSSAFERVPLDPTGVPYVLDRSNQDVRIARESQLWPVPEGMEHYRQ
jgi:hypothetical protein